MKEAFLLILLLATQVFAEDPLSALLGAKASFVTSHGPDPETPVLQADNTAYGALDVADGAISDVGGVSQPGGSISPPDTDHVRDRSGLSVVAVLTRRPQGVFFRP